MFNKYKQPLFSMLLLAFFLVIFGCQLSVPISTPTTAYPKVTAQPSITAGLTVPEEPTPVVEQSVEPSPSVFLYEQEDATPPDLLLEKVPATDDLLFFSNSVDSIVGGVATNFYSASTKTREFTCITCKLQTDLAGDYAVFSLPADLSPDRQTFVLGGGIVKKGGGAFKEELWFVDLPSGRVRIAKVPESSFRHPTWSPDGKLIAYTGADGAIGIIDVGGDELIFSSRNTPILLESEGLDLNLNAHVSDGYFTWSPDGTYLLYSAETQYIVRFNTNQLTATVLKPNQPATNYHGFTYPAWSPTGNQIMFTSVNAERPTGVTVKQLFGDAIEFIAGEDAPIMAQDLYIVNMDGSRPACLTCETDVPLDMALTPAWSPSGNLIAFFGYDFSESPVIHECLFVFELNNKTIRNIFRFTTQDPSIFSPSKTSGPPRWSRDGQWLAFSAPTEGSYAIFRVNIDGSNLQMVAHEPGQNYVFPYIMGE